MTGVRVDCYQTQSLESSLELHRARNVDHPAVAGSILVLSHRQRQETTSGSPVMVQQRLKVARKRLT